eukprot:symbB.v1.2.012604.t1/scaffold820.1/size171332/11
MFSKQALPKLDEEPDAPRRFRANVRDLFLTNQLSAERTSSLLGDAAAAGVEALEDVKNLEGKGGKNVQRDLMRKFAKRAKQWPDLYWSKVDVWDKKKQKVKREWIAVLLPHEWLCKLNSKVPDGSLTTWEGLGPLSQGKCARACSELGCSTLTPLSFWCDGVPYNWDRSESLEVMNVALPGIPQWRNLRIPFACIEHKVLCENTFSQIFDILLWSLQSLATGEHPLSRHDSLDWLVTDKARKKLAGKTHNCKAVLHLIKADWKAFKEIFAFPGWQGRGALCWLCNATLQDMRCKDSTGVDEALDHWGFLIRQRLHLNKPISNLLAAPTLRVHQFRPDWLHSKDQGVTADFLGNFLLWTLLPKMAGCNQAEKIRSLFVLIEAYYAENLVQQKYNNLTIKMLQKKKSTPPKLRGRASEVKGLVPFAKQAAEGFCNSNDPVEDTVKVAAAHLNNLYQIVFAKEQFNAQAMKDESFKFRTLLRALEEYHSGAGGNKWRLKPKLHLMEEICEKQTDCPIDHATYRDEDWGGAMARWAKKRGGYNSVASTSRNALTKFCANNRLPAF